MDELIARLEGVLEHGVTGNTALVRVELFEKAVQKLRELQRAAPEGGSEEPLRCDGCGNTIEQHDRFLRCPAPAAPAGGAVAWSVLQIGNVGAAYDPAGSRRAFTYEHQPGNVDSGRLGRALLAAGRMSAGDSIDAGLGLLKALQSEGFGVFQIGQPAPAAQGFDAAAKRLIKLWRTPEPDNGESHTEFDKGYEQASAECADTLERALAAAAKGVGR